MAYKGTDKDGKCRDFQYEVGKEYTTYGKISLCESGFHACENPFNVLDFYDANGGNRFFEVQQSGTTLNDEIKTVSSRIMVKAEIGFHGLIKAGVNFLLKHSKTQIAQGDSGHAAAQGYSGHAAAQGDRGHAAAQGDSGHAAAQGYSGHAAAQGDRGHAATQGKDSVAVSFGICGRAMSKQGWIVIVDWRNVENTWTINAVHTAKIGGKIGRTKIKPDTWYWFENGKLHSEKGKNN